MSHIKAMLRGTHRWQIVALTDLWFCQDRVLSRDVTLKRARPVSVGNVRESRGGCGRAKPPAPARSGAVGSSVPAEAWTSPVESSTVTI
jgi:hypothetical protein